MFPLFKCGPIVIPSYVLFVALGFFISSFLIDYFAESFSLSKSQGFYALCSVELGVLLGAKLVYIIINVKRIFTSHAPFLSILKSGFVLYGGILGAVLAVFLFSFFTKKSFYPTLSLISLVAPLIQFFGRIGCFCAGCCYGIPYNGYFSIFIAGEYRYPTQIASAIFNLFLFFTLLILFKKNKQKYLIPVYLFVYGIGRFVIEQFRGDTIRGFLGPLSISSWISIFCIFIGMIILIKIRKIIQTSNISP